MAARVVFIRDDTLDGLAAQINRLLAEAAEDARFVVEVLTVFCDPTTHKYVALIQRTAPHLRQFEATDADH